jgi:hypothetical protein
MNECHFNYFCKIKPIEKPVIQNTASGLKLPRLFKKPVRSRCDACGYSQWRVFFLVTAFDANSNYFKQLQFVANLFDKNSVFRLRACIKFFITGYKRFGRLLRIDSQYRCTADDPFTGTRSTCNIFT